MSKPQDNIERALGALALVGRVLTGRQLAGRGATVFPDDVFLVSYPRSGNTWTRFLLGNLIYQDEPVTFSNIESRIPEIYFNPRPPVARACSPADAQESRVFSAALSACDLYRARSPRCCDFLLPSQREGEKHRGRLSHDLLRARFIAGEFDPKFGSWRDNVLSWISVRRDSPNMMLSYEEMKHDTAGALRQIVAFLQHRWSRKIASSPEALARAIELSSPERMRDLERRQAASWVLTKSTRSDKSFVRTAKAGGWKSELAPESVAAIESAWGKLMQQLGYQPISGSKETPVESISRQETGL